MIRSLLGLSLLGFAAGCCPPTTAYVLCSSTTACPSGQTCQNGVCAASDGGASSSGTSSGSSSSSTSSSSGSSSGGSSGTSVSSSSGTTSSSSSGSSSGASKSSSSSSSGTSSSSSSSSSSGGVPCETDLSCGDGGYCLVPLTACSAFSDTYIEDAGVCHRNCETTGCVCDSDEDCPSGTCSSGSCIEEPVSCAASDCITACPLTSLDEESCPICLCGGGCPPPPACVGPTGTCTTSSNNICGTGGCCGDLQCNGSLVCCIPPATCASAAGSGGPYACNTACDCPCCGGPPATYADCNSGVCGSCAFGSATGVCNTPPKCILSGDTCTLGAEPCCAGGLCQCAISGGTTTCSCG